MKSRLIYLLLALFLVTETQPALARPRRSKSCARKVLLPGHSKAVKCSKARKMKNNYF
jgi:hypothetical protein